MVELGMRFRKKPVEVSALHFSPNTIAAVGAHEVARWCGGTVDLNGGVLCIIIPTLEGDHRADIGDWIIRGVAGEFYPCKPDIFDATYDSSPDPGGMGV